MKKFLFYAYSTVILGYEKVFLFYAWSAFISKHKKKLFSGKDIRNFLRLEFFCFSGLGLESALDSPYICYKEPG